MSNSNNLFKALCGIVVPENRPNECANISITGNFSIESNNKLNKEIISDTYKQSYSMAQEYDQNLEGLEKRTTLTDLLIVFWIVIILLVGFFTWRVIFNRPSSDERLHT